MIKPISISNQHLLENRQKEKQQSNIVATQSFTDFSGYDVGQALKAQYGIGFKQSSMPIETTHLYNKKVENEKHLDLPNIHVYEYPDTNLQLFVNIDDSIKQNEQSIMFFIEEENPNLIKSGILKHIIEQKVLETLPAGFINTHGNGINYGLSYDRDFNKNIKDLNKIVTNLEFSENDLSLAKKNFINYLNTDDYRNNATISLALYEPSQIKSNNEILQEINNLTFENIKDYYRELNQKSTIQAYLTIPSLDFEQNKKNILKNINLSISEKFKPNNNQYSETNFELNNETKFINSDLNKYSFYFPVKFQNTKDSYLAHIVSCVLNDSTNLFNAKNKIYTTPVELKENAIRKHDNAFLKFEFDSEITLNDFRKTIKEIDIASNLQKVKEYQKERLNEIFSENSLPEIKTNEMFLQDKEIFSVYEIIDSITEDDVKTYLENYFIKQKPIVQTGV